jgi:hypothetical protein
MCFLVLFMTSERELSSGEIYSMNAKEVLGVCASLVHNHCFASSRGIDFN